MSSPLHRQVIASPIIGSALMKSAFTGLALIGLAMTSTGAHAMQCGSTFQHNGDYRTVQATEFDDKTLRAVDDFVQRIDGDWEGAGLDIRCSGSNDESRSTITNFDVEAEISRHWTGRSVIQVEQDSDRFVSLERFTLSPDTEHNLIDSYGNKTNQNYDSIDFSTPNTMVYKQKYRVVIERDDPEAVDGTRTFIRHVFEIKTVSLSDDQNALTVNRDIYVNGRFSAQQEWQLYRS